MLAFLNPSDLVVILSLQPMLHLGLGYKCRFVYQLGSDQWLAQTDIRRAPHKTALGTILDLACVVWAQGAESSVSVQNPSDPAQKYISCLKSTSMALFDHIFQLPSSYFSGICTNRENFLVGILLPPSLPPFLPPSQDFDSVPELLYFNKNIRTINKQMVKI